MTKVAVTQMSLGWDVEANLDKAEATVRAAAAKGANIILLQELFATVYFCPDQNPKYFDHAYEVEGHPFLGRFADLRRDLFGCLLPFIKPMGANNRRPCHR